ncbi:Hydrogen cyanide synthase subunit HcnC [Pseudoalteromonas holothuriae]|uniref:Hydrogen cyanide synthase subunit HcnC n=1 Tax=Pseudoalteromonas holothuriae TaxID=2963714 RepID=A0A9W4W4B4_9GAMM|nr:MULTISPECIES: FAD-dependent oxidoreductase [unclassified Pseudoalteromonas]CAH9058090.1 Hydrogen cyanide synthase subunit HcnC [Pseudoalteromonas sp. CIP111951]CAH9058598.1 Hydrogen cyanide synthase subunit HcnC [Pseudoalteromonas sp. CIP111854]
MIKNKQKIAVIGAGIIGLCNAKKLQDLGYHVTLFDDKGIAECCSKGNAGHFATEQVFPLANKNLLPKLPSMLLNPNSALAIHWRYLFKILPWFGRFVFNMRSKSFDAHTQAIRALNENALSAYEDLLTDSDYQSLIIKKGSLLTFERTKKAEIEKIYTRYQEQNIAVRWLSKKELHKLEPNLNELITDALYFTDVGHSVEPHKLCLHIFDLFKAGGGEFLQTAIKTLSPQTVIHATTDADETYQFDKVVICTGAWSKPLAKQLGFKVPLDTERGYHAMLNKHHILSRPIASAERQFIITPMQQGLRLAGTVEFAGLHAPEHTQRATMLLEHAKKLLPDVEKCQVQHTWMGCRPSLPDSLPVISSHPNCENIFFAFGHQHLGLTQAAITAKLIAQLCQGESPCLDLTPYRIDRF